MTTAEEIRYADALGHDRTWGRTWGRRSTDLGDEDAASFRRYFSRISDHRRGSDERDADGREASTSDRSEASVERLAKQAREYQAKLAERTNELDAAKERNQLMQEHIESLTDKEDIVRGNKGSLLLVVILVLILAATASAWWCEPVGVRVAKAMVTRWGGTGDGTCGKGGVLGSLFSN